MNEPIIPSTGEVRADYVRDHTRSFDSYQAGRTMVSEQEFYGEKFDRWLAEVERAAAEKLEAELEARIEDRDYWYRIATEAKDQHDAALSTIVKVRGIVELLYPGEMTPTAKRHLARALGSVPSTGEGNDGSD